MTTLLRGHDYTCAVIEGENERKRRRRRVERMEKKRIEKRKSQHCAHSKKDQSLFSFPN